MKWLAAVGFVATLIAYYPGNMHDNDSVDQFAQSLTLRFNDWHPVAMALLWSAFNRAWAGPQTMLVLQLALYWTSAYLLLSLVPDDTVAWRRVTAIALVGAPFVVVFLDEIVKDVQLAAAWSFAAVWAYWIRSKGRALTVVETIVLAIVVVYGGLVRNHAAVVPGPLLLYVLVGRAVLASRWRTVAAYVLVGIAVVGSSKGLAAAARAAPSTQLRLLLTFDLAGMSKTVNANLLPMPLTDSELARVLDSYDPSTQDCVREGPEGFVWAREDASGMNIAEVLRRWIEEVAAHPGAYVVHRARFVKGFGLVRPNEPWSHVARSIVTKPFLWAVLLAAVIAWFAESGVSGAARAFVETEIIVAAAYLATYVPFGVSFGFRYSYLTIACITFSACVLVATVQDDTPNQTVALG